MLDLAASTSQMGRFETGAMTSTQNLTALADVSGRSAAPAGGPTCVRGMPCTARQGQEEPWHILGENGWRILTENLQGYVNFAA